MSYAMKPSLGVDLDYQEIISDQTASPEKRLWLAVLSQTLREAFGRHADADQQKAIDWLYSPAFERDRKIVLAMAGMDYDVLIEQVRSVVCARHHVYPCARCQ